MSKIATPQQDKDRRPVFSALWVTVLLNALFRDVHEALRPGMIAEVMGGTLNGAPLGDGLFIAAALFLQIPLAMVVLSHLLPPASNRRVNVSAALLVLIALAGTDSGDADDAIFAVMQALALLAILWQAGYGLPGRRMVARRGGLG